MGRRAGAHLSGVDLRQPGRRQPAACGRRCPSSITRSLGDYEALALKLARDPALLASLRQKLARNRERYPLFDTDRFTRHIEAAYTTMWERSQRGEPPAELRGRPDRDGAA